MPVLHVFKFILRGDTPQSEADRVCSGFLELQTRCKKDNKPYISSMKGGRQISDANSKTPSLQYVPDPPLPPEYSAHYFPSPLYRSSFCQSTLKPHAAEIQGMEFGVGKF
ncbi:hypothetical protein GGG16DRAFT_96869 [Schizophyllum commune]